MKKYIKLLLICSMVLCLFGCQKKIDYETIEQNTQLPIVQIHTKDLKPINKKQKIEREAIFEIINSNGYDIKIDCDDEGNYPMTIKGRGNSSWTMPTLKKPYNIKFSEKVDLFGYGEAKKWSLIASWTDTSFVRNYIGYKLARTLDETSPDCELVELFINDYYDGIYLLCESYGINKNRVETKGDGKDINGDGEITEFLIEADSRAKENNEPNRFKINDSYYMVIKEPDEEEILDETDSRYLHVKEYYQKVNDAIVNLNHYEDYIDVDSLVDMYIINEYLKNPDYGFGNQPYYASTFMYMEEGGKLYFGPMWDCDISMGRNNYKPLESEGYRDTYTPEGYLTGDTHWINTLLKDEAFVNKVKERWKEFRVEVIDMIENTAPEIIDKVRQTYIYDYQTWNEKYDQRTTTWSNRVPYDFEKECEYVLNFMKTRLQWMDEQFL